MKNKGIRFSIYSKVLILVLLFAVLINAGVYLFFTYSSDFKPPKTFHRYSEKYFQYLSKDIGFPPDTARARKESVEMNFRIRFQSANFNWATADSVITLEELNKSDEFKDKYPFSESFRIFYNEKVYFIVKLEKGVYIFAPRKYQDYFNVERSIFILLILTAAIFIPLFIFLRLLLHPIKKLRDSVEKIGEGNFDAKTFFKRKDELSDLSNSINTMADKIKDSITAKEQLLIGVSHELRTPLTRINMELELDSPKEKIKEDIEEIEAMISYILENYRISSGEIKINKEQINLKNFLETNIMEYSNLTILPENCDIQILSEESNLKVIVRNILDNANKYTDEKGTVKIWAEDLKDKVKIYFADNGTGIEEKELKLIFEPFYRVDTSRCRKTGGFGLGLAIVKKLVEAHGGSIEVKSEIGKGTTVIISLPK